MIEETAVPQLKLAGVQSESENDRPISVGVIGL
jgi:hypothetical protein